MAYIMADYFVPIINGPKLSSIYGGPFSTYLVKKLGVLNPDIMGHLAFLPKETTTIGISMMRSMKIIRLDWYGLLQNQGNVWHENQEEGGEEEGEVHHHESPHVQIQDEFVAPSPSLLRGYYYGPPYPDDVAVMYGLEQTMGQFRELMLDTHRDFMGYMLDHRVDQY